MKLGRYSWAAVVLAAPLLSVVAVAQTNQPEAPGAPLNIPENVQVVGTANPSFRTATAIVNGDVITETDIDQRLALYLRDLQTEYAGTGLTVVAPTKRYGYVAKRQPASPADELAYIKSIRAEHYPWMPDTMVPVSAEVFTRYGVSTTPTLVFINRDGRVRLYHPGQMTREEIEPVVKAMTAGTSH